MGRYNEPLFPASINRAQNNFNATHCHKKTGNGYWVFDLEINATTGELMIRYMDALGFSYSRTVEEFPEKFTLIHDGDDFKNQWWRNYYDLEWHLEVGPATLRFKSAREMFNHAFANDLIDEIGDDFLNDRADCKLKSKATHRTRWTRKGAN